MVCGGLWWIAVVCLLVIPLCCACGCGGQESEPDGRSHLPNCDTQERTNCCTTGETTSGELLTGLLTLSKEGHSKH